MRTRNTPKSKPMNLLFLSANFVPQHVSFIRSLIDYYQVEVHSIHISREFTFVPDNVVGLSTYKKDGLSREEMLQLALELKPSLLYVAGYADADFLWLCKRVRKQMDVPVVSGCDTQWRKTWKQRILSLFAPWYIQPAFSHFMVAGAYQYEWVRKLGYSKENILWNLYSGDTDKFESIQPLGNPEPIHRELFFVGRLVPQKGIDLLLKCWQDIKDHRGWTLKVAGEGVLKDAFADYPNVRLLGYLSQEELVQEASRSSGFILPSVFEPWAVVIHEFAAAGLPLVCSSACGAVSHLLIHGYNGYVFSSGDERALSHCLKKLLEASDLELATMGKRSRELSRRITPATSAANLMSVLF